MIRGDKSKAKIMPAYEYMKQWFMDLSIYVSSTLNFHFNNARELWINKLIISCCFPSLCDVVNEKSSEIFCNFFQQKRKVEDGTDLSLVSWKLFWYCGCGHRTFKHSIYWHTIRRQEWEISLIDSHMIFPFRFPPNNEYFSE